MLGENFTEEYRYPIKIYRIKEIEFANGVEVRKIIFSLFLGMIMILSFLLIGIKSETNIIKFFAKNWLILLIVVPSLITFIVFNLKYDHKYIIPFIKDRMRFYLTKNKRYEHFIEVPNEQIKKELVFESFHREVENKWN